MTRGDFILGVLSSLVATILFELARKFYPRLKNKSLKGFGGRVVRITLAISSLLVTPLKRVTAQKVSVRVLSYSMILALGCLTLVNIPLHSVLAPSQDRSFIPPQDSIDSPITDPFKRTKPATLSGSDKPTPYRRYSRPPSRPSRGKPSIPLWKVQSIRIKDSERELYEMIADRPKPGNIRIIHAQLSDL